MTCNHSCVDIALLLLQAQRLALRLLEEGALSSMHDTMRQFALMPLMHAEDREMSKVSGG